MSEAGIEPVHINCHFDDVSPEVLFNAWVNPEIMAKWLFLGPTSEIEKIETDLTPGGKFCILELDKSTGEYIDHFGIYNEIEDPLRLEFTLSVPKHFSEETTVTVHIFPTLNGSELKLTQVGVSKDKTEKNWQDMLHELKRMLEVNSSPGQL